MQSEMQIPFDSSAEKTEGSAGNDPFALEALCAGLFSLLSSSRLSEVPALLIRNSLHGRFRSFLEQFVYVCDFFFSSLHFSEPDYMKKVTVCVGWTPSVTLSLSAYFSFLYLMHLKQ